MGMKKLLLIHLVGIVLLLSQDTKLIFIEAKSSTELDSLYLQVDTLLTTDKFVYFVIKQVRYGMDCVDSIFTYLPNRNNIHEIYGDLVDNKSYLEMFDINLRLTLYNLLSERYLEKFLVFNTIYSEVDDNEAAHIELNLFNKCPETILELMKKNKIIRDDILERFEHRYNYKWGAGIDIYENYNKYEKQINELKKMK